MKFRNLALSLATVLISVASAQADSSAVTFVLEPYLGWGTGGFTSKNSGMADVDLGSLSGIVLGGRGYLKFAEMFFVGPDLAILPGTSLSASDTAKAQNLDEYVDILRVRLGVVAGIELPVLPLRFWLGYNFIDNMGYNDPTPTLGRYRSSTIDYILKGKSFKLGASYSILPILAANVEYIMTSYTSLDHLRGTTDFASGSSMNNNQIQFSLSLPIPLK